MKIKYTLIVVFLSGCQFAISQNTIDEDLKPISEKIYKSINASVGLGNLSFNSGVPNLLLTFEKNGVFGSNAIDALKDFENLFNTGVYLEYSSTFLSTLGLGVRLAADPLEFVNQFSNTRLAISEKLDVNIGLQWGYLLFFSEFLGTTGSFRRGNLYLNGRYYFAKNIGIHFEVGRTAYISDLNIGISLRY